MTSAAWGAVNYVWTEYIWPKLQWVKDQVSGFVDWLWGKINAVLGPVGDWIGKAATWFWEGLWAFIRDPVGTLTYAWNWIIEEVWKKLVWVKDRLSEGWTWLTDQVSTGLNNLYTAVSTTVSNVAASVGTAVTGLWDSLTGLAGDLLAGMAEALGSGLQAVADWLLKHLTWLGEMIVGAMNAVKAAVQPIIQPFLLGIINTATAGLMPGSPDVEIQQATDAFSHQLLQKLSEIPPIRHSPQASLTELLVASAGVIGASLLTSYGMTSVAAYLDLAHPAKMTGIMHVADDMLYSLNFPAMIGPIIFSNIYAGIILPLRYRWNQIYTAMIPDESSLARFRAKGLIGGSEYLEAMSFHGYRGEYAAIYEQDAARIPPVMDLNRMLWRDALTMMSFEGALRSTGVREDFIPGYVALTESLPSYMDMIRIYVREGYLEEYQREIPGGMVADFAKLGYSEAVTRQLWGAHWVLPSVGQVFEMLHRDVVDEATTSTYLKTADILSVWRDRLIAISWDLPGRIDARWMASWGLIDVEDYGDILVKRGLDPEWRDRVAEATIKQQMEPEINRLRDNAKRDLVDGLILEATLRADLEELGFPPDYVEYHVADALHDRLREHKRALLDIYEDAYQKKMIEWPTFEERVTEILVDQDARDDFLEKAWIKMWKAPRAG